jgi:hypothetical protein
MARRFMTARPLLGSALAGLAAFGVFVAICLAAGEDVAQSVSAGVFLGIAVGGALALANVLSRRRVR